MSFLMIVSLAYVTIETIGNSQREAGSCSIEMTTGETGAATEGVGKTNYGFQRD